MFIIFIIHSISQHINEFQDIDMENKLLLVNQEERFEKLVYITTDGTTGSRSTRSYFRCTVEISGNTKFINCFALGLGFTFGSGGAIYLSASNLVIRDNVLFSLNKALSGGAVSCIGSICNIVGSENITFSENHAYKIGGALFIGKSKVGLLTEVDDSKKGDFFLNAPPVTCHIENVVFISNSCDEESGCILLGELESSTLINCHFLNNQAGVGGGGLSIYSCGCNLYKCSFYNNKCGSITKKLHNITNVFSFKESQRNGKRRGGGGILLINFNNNSQYSLNTLQCCFSNNQDIRSYQGTLIGNDLVINGNCKYISTNDIFDHERTQSILDRNINSEIRIFIQQSIFLANNNQFYEASCFNHSTFTSIISFEQLPLQTPYLTYNNSLIFNESIEPEPTLFNTILEKTPEISINSIIYPPQTNNIYLNTIPPIRSTSIPTPSPSLIVPTKTLQKGSFTIVGEISIIETKLTQTYSHLIISFETYLETFNTITLTFVNTFIATFYTISFYSFSPIYSYYLMDEEINQNESNNIIIWISSIILLIGLIGFFIYKFLNLNDKEETNSEHEMNEETLSKITDDTSIALTNDNPLWDMNTKDNLDDPFKQDFEEEYILRKLK